MKCACCYGTHAFLWQNRCTCNRMHMAFFCVKNFVPFGSFWLWLFSSTGFIYSLYSFLLNSIFFSRKKCIQQLNHPLSESEQPCDALFESICCLYHSWTVTYFERSWKNITISASGKCFMGARDVLEIELKFLLYRVFLPLCISNTIKYNLSLIFILFYRIYTFMNHS